MRVVRVGVFLSLLGLLGGAGGEVCAQGMPGTRGADAPRPRVRVELVEVSGRADESTIMMAIKKRRGALRRCYEYVLAQDPTFDDRVNVRVDVTHAGRVRGVTILTPRANRLGVWRFDSCLQRQLSLVLFSVSDAAWEAEWSLGFEYEERVSATLSPHLRALPARGLTASEIEERSTEELAGELRRYVRLGKVWSARKLYRVAVLHHDPFELLSDDTVRAALFRELGRAFRARVKEGDGVLDRRALRAGSDYYLFRSDPDGFARAFGALDVDAVTLIEFARPLEVYHPGVTGDVLSARIQGMDKTARVGFLDWSDGVVAPQSAWGVRVDALEASWGDEELSEEQVKELVAYRMRAARMEGAAELLLARCAAGALDAAWCAESARLLIQSGRLEEVKGLEALMER